jgi:hypothetical protein
MVAVAALALSSCLQYSETRTINGATSRIALVVTVPAATAATADEAAQRDGFPVNARGETYGSGVDAISPEQEPDLILATGVDGTQGYVRADELSPPIPDPATFAGEDREIPLYAADGVTVIGTFIMHAGVVTTTPLPGR